MAAEKHTAVAVADLEFDGIRNLRDLSEEFGQMKSGLFTAVASTYCNVDLPCHQ